MKKFAQIENNLVSNIANFDDTAEEFDNWIDVTGLPCAIGWPIVSSVPDPKPSKWHTLISDNSGWELTPENEAFANAETSQTDYESRQNARIANLKGALINQFKMILALFQVGRDNGVWTVSDFDSELVTIAQQWIALIDEYENDAP